MGMAILSMVIKFKEWPITSMYLTTFPIQVLILISMEET